MTIRKKQIIRYWRIETKKSALSRSKSHNKCENRKRDEQIKRKIYRKTYWRHTYCGLSLEGLIQN